MELRPPRSGAASTEVRSLYTIGSASKWVDDTIGYVRIRVSDNENMFPESVFPDEAQFLRIPEWTDQNWLKRQNIDDMLYDSNVLSLLSKIQEVCEAGRSMVEVQVDGFMNSLLFLLGFDNYPCRVFPQYAYSFSVGSQSSPISARCDFGVLHRNRQLLLVIEDKTVAGATYANSWKESQVLGELFVAVHDYVKKSGRNVQYPVIVHAVRVVGTLFTFYKAFATLDYIRETSRLGYSINNEMVVERCPPVEDIPSALTAYDICTAKDREKILQSLCYIRKLAR